MSGASRTSSANDKLQYVSRSRHNTYLTYIEQLYITPLHLQIELNIKPDGCDDDESYETLTLNALAQSIDSAFVAGVLSWLINVGSNFAHVSPSFRYKEISDVDRYRDALDLAADLAISYIVSTIKQVSAGKFPWFPTNIHIASDSHARLSCSATRLYSQCIYL